MGKFKIGLADFSKLVDRLDQLAAAVQPCVAYEGVHTHGFAKCGDGTCANTNSADSCRGGCNGWD